MRHFVLVRRDMYNNIAISWRFFPNSQPWKCSCWRRLLQAPGRRERLRKKNKKSARLRRAQNVLLLLKMSSKQFFRCARLSFSWCAQELKRGESIQKTEICRLVKFQLQWMQPSKVMVESSWVKKSRGKHFLNNLWFEKVSTVSFISAKPVFSFFGYRTTKKTKILVSFISAKPVWRIFN